MNLLAPVKDIMTTEIVSVGLDASIAQVGEIFSTKRIHHIPVVENEVLKGIVSKSDYLFFRRGFDKALDKKLEQMRLNSYKVDFIMTKGIATVEPDTRINVVLEIFKENLFHAVPVTEGDKIVGIVTTYDIINRLADDAKAESTYS